MNVYSHYSANDDYGNSEYCEDMEDATGITVWVEGRCKCDQHNVEREDHYFPFHADGWEQAQTVCKAAAKAEEMAEKYNCPHEFY